MDHFKHYSNNLTISEEEDIMETGEFIFLWPIFEEIYTEMNMDKFGDVSTLSALDDLIIDSWLDDKEQIRRT